MLMMSKMHQLSVGAQPEITFVSAGSGSVTGSPSGLTPMPAHQSGDLIIVHALSRGGSDMTTPAGFTNLDFNRTQISSGNKVSVGFRIATSSAESTGYWELADVLSAIVFRGTSASPIGGFSVTNADGATVTYPSLTMSINSGTSWVLCLGLVNTRFDTLENAPAGLTRRFNFAHPSFNLETAGFDTNGGVKSFAGGSTSLGGGVGFITHTIELKAA